MSIPLDAPKPLMDQGSQNNLNPNYQTAQLVSDYCTPLRSHLPQVESNLPINIHPLTLQAHPQGMCLTKKKNSLLVHIMVNFRPEIMTRQNKLNLQLSPV